MPRLITDAQKDHIVTLYLTPMSNGLQRTQKEVAQEADVSDHTVYNILKERDIFTGPRGPRGVAPAIRQKIIQEYTTRLPDGTWKGATAIAREYGISQPGALRYLRDAGVAIRDAKEAHAHGKACKPVKNLPQGEAPLCKCGCGNPVQWQQRGNKWQAYCPGHYRPDAPYMHYDWLYEHYVTKAHTLQEIGDMFGIIPSGIAYQLEKVGIPRRDMSASRIGRQAKEKNPAWKGGTSPERQRLYKAGNWRQIVQAIYARDKFTCQRCGAPKGGPKSLHAHHLEPWADNVALRFDPANLITLCRTCHTWVHSKQNEQREYLR